MTDNVGPAGRRPRAWHPVLFAAFPILFLLARSISEQVTLSEAARPLGITIGAAALLYAGLTPLLRSAHRAAVVVSIGTLLFFTYGHAARLLQPVSIGSLSLGAPRVLGVLWALLLGLTVWLALRAAPSLPRLTRALNVISLFLVLINVASVARGVVARRETQASSLGSIEDAAAGEPAGAGPARDVYYLIFDRYAGAETLEKYYGFRNDEFLGYLRDEGFFVPAETWANYPRTTASLAASLSMDYLTFLEPVEVGKVYGVFDAPRVGRTFRERGYTTVNVGSWWEVTEEDPSADVNIKLTEGSQFEDRLLEGTAFAPLEESSGSGFRRREFERLPAQFEAIAEIGDSDARTFTFAHFLLPHEPFIWNAEGRFMEREELRRWKYPRRYVEHVRFANRKITELVEQLLDVPPDEQPIIIIQSDEGPEPVDAWGDYIQDWASASPEQREQKLRILSAFYFPGLDETSLYEEISPVNIFRVLFNDYFGTSLELLPDRTYVDLESRADVTAELQRL